MVNMMAKSEAAAYRPFFEDEFDEVVDSEAVNISIFENEIPPFVEQELDLLYGNLYSSLAQFRINGKLRNVSTYVVRKGGKAVQVFLFRIEGGRVEVLNEVIAISADHIRQFATIIFSRFRAAKLISFQAIQTDLQHLSFPIQKINCLEDIVVTLPTTSERYLADLGKNTRRNIKRYTNRLQADFPELEFRIHVQAEASEQMIRNIVDLNKARMKGKNKVSAIDEQEVDKLIKLVRACGMVCVATMNGKICAGGISFRVGANYFLNVLAHDPAFDNYWLGILCCYHTIGECIVRHGKEFHFLWGRYDYKTTLLGIRRDLDSLVVYRSHLQILLNIDLAAVGAIKGRIRQLTLWLQEEKRRDSRAYHVAARILDWVQKLKQFRWNVSGIAK